MNKGKMETTAQLLNRLATQHLDSKIQKYIQQLEAVAEVAKLVLNNKENLPELRRVLEDLEDAA